MAVKITSKRQVTLPKRVLDAMGVQPGDRLSLEEGPDGFVLRPRRIALSKLGTAGDKIRRGRGTFDLQAFRDEPQDPALRD